MAEFFCVIKNEGEAIGICDMSKCVVTIFTKIRPHTSSAKNCVTYFENRIPLILTPYYPHHL